ncbi:MAG: hypothetical protein K6G70_05125 [Bacteroidaceae bacterium]|nr:hypothetical protein [Bacteroidaceae bacterium]
MKRIFSLLIALTCVIGMMAQAVIFPQEKQAGKATLVPVAMESSETDGYILGNDLFNAAFERTNGVLRFGGCEQLGLQAGTELFALRLGNGTEVAASEMTLGEVRMVDLAADATAAKGSLKLPGKALEADYTYNNLQLTWRAVLRDGSHYLRTELELTALKNTAMNAIIPMHYMVDNTSLPLGGGQEGAAPVVVGNTRGAVIASDRIFAGLETPMGKNSIVGAMSADPFAYDRWTSTTFSWEPGTDTPQGIINLGLPASGICATQGYLAIMASGTQKVTFQYTSGRHRLDIAGVDIVDPTTGEVVAKDYHKGYTGGAKSNNVYSLRIPKAGYYLVRYFRDTVTDGITAAFDSNGTITWSCQVLAPELLFDGNTAENVLPDDEDIPTLTNPVLSVGGTRTDAWTTSSWAAPASVPSRIIELGYEANRIKMMEKTISFDRGGGTFNAQFMYASGNHGLTIAGVELVDADGNVVASDYHKGFSGTAKTDNDYTFTVPAAGNYTLRYYVVLNPDGSDNTSSGNINLSYALKYYYHLPAPTETEIVGEWSRQTTLAKGKTWKVGAVVGLIAPGQARRSFLCYSERERAVPWRPFPMYNSWFELNINRNNDPDYTGNFNESQCMEVLNQWKTKLFDKHGVGIGSFVWDDGWDIYGTWEFNPNFPNGFQELSDKAWSMDSHIGAWLGPVGGYGQSGNYRRSYWSSKGGMQLSNPDYYNVFLDRTSYMLNTYHFNFFKFDGISAQFSSIGPDAGATGEENAEGIINIEQELRKVKPDVFLNTTVGTWASPFWFQVSDAVWRQENDWGTAGNQGNTREQWITYRDRLVYQNFVQNSPLCPINTLMTHGFILSKYGGGAANMSQDYSDIVREMRCAFACGSGMVEIYADYALMNSINNGKLWGELAACIKWQKEQEDVLPDVHWVGGNPWDGSKANVYGWAAWNGKKATLALRNPSTSQQTFKITLREALDIPEYINTTITLSKAFTQNSLTGLPVGQPIDIDQQLSIRLPGSSVFVFNGTDDKGSEVGIRQVKHDGARATLTNDCYDLSGRKASTSRRGLYVVNGQKVAK